MKRFYLIRYQDISGVSGAGVVAEGVQFMDGRVVICWVTNGIHGIVIHENIENVKQIHGHNGATQIRWVDEDCTDEDRSEDYLKRLSRL
jgi:hypothetical protein